MRAITKHCLISIMCCMQSFYGEIQVNMQLSKNVHAMIYEL